MSYFSLFAIIKHYNKKVSYEGKNRYGKKMSLHDSSHHSFIFGLRGDELLKLMISMAAQRYFDIHGLYPPRLDKIKITLSYTKDAASGLL